MNYPPFIFNNQFDGAWTHPTHVSELDELECFANFEMAMFLTVGFVSVFLQIFGLPARD